MPQYSEGFRERAVQMMMPPNAMSVAQVSRETGVSEQTLYNWRNRFRHEGRAVPADSKNPENWSGENKLAVVIETAALNEEQLAEYCRKKGLYAEQVMRWREAAIAGPCGCGRQPLNLLSANSHRWELIDGLEGMAEEVTLAVDKVSGDYTRLSRFKPEANTSSVGSKSHDYQEEIMIIEG
jgi:transposase-like protein